MTIFAHKSMFGPVAVVASSKEARLAVAVVAEASSSGQLLA